jgi:hypothetical protein
VGFEIVAAGRWSPVDPLEQGEISICRSGTATFRAEDLASVGIDKPWVTVLADPSTLRVAVRPVRSGEEQGSVAVSNVMRSKGKIDSGRRRISLARAIRHCGLTTAAVAARYNLHVKDDQLLIINLTDGPVGDKKQRALDAGGMAGERVDAPLLHGGHQKWQLRDRN